MHIADTRNSFAELLTMGLPALIYCTQFGVCCRNQEDNLRTNVSQQTPKREPCETQTQNRRLHKDEIH